MANQQDQQEDQTFYQEDCFQLEEEQLEGVTGGIDFVKAVRSLFKKREKYEDPYAEAAYHEQQKKWSGKSK